MEQKIIQTSNSIFPEREDELYELIQKYIAPSYLLDRMDDDTISELITTEFSRIRELICQQYSFDENKHIMKNGNSPFDFIQDKIEHEILSRITYKWNHEKYND